MAFNPFLSGNKLPFFSKLYPPKVLYSKTKAAKAFYFAVLTAPKWQLTLKLLPDLLSKVI
jgi:hypothetical protein